MLRTRKDRRNADDVIPRGNSNLVLANIPLTQEAGVPNPSLFAAGKCLLEPRQHNAERADCLSGVRNRQAMHPAELSTQLAVQPDIPQFVTHHLPHITQHQARGLAPVAAIHHPLRITPVKVVQHRVRHREEIRRLLQDRRADEYARVVDPIRPNLH